MFIIDVSVLIKYSPKYISIIYSYHFISKHSITINHSFHFLPFQLSNFLFLLLPPILIHLFRDYGQFVNPGIHVIWVLMIVVGLSSAYFHATLSLIGQLLDELAILWVCAAAFSLFFPKKFFPRCLNGNRLVQRHFIIFYLFIGGEQSLKIS